MVDFNDAPCKIERVTQTSGKIGTCRKHGVLIAFVYFLIGDEALENGGPKPHRLRCRDTYGSGSYVHSHAPDLVKHFRYPVCDKDCQDQRWHDAVELVGNLVINYNIREKAGTPCDNGPTQE